MGISASLHGDWRVVFTSFFYKKMKAVSWQRQINAIYKTLIQRGSKTVIRKEFILGFVFP